MKLLKAEAGVNDGKAGLLSAAGLFAKGGIFDKKSESFNIHELDPYLLFDAQSSMLGTLEAETLDLDPATPSTLDVITATRAGTATYTDASGNVATAPSDTVRVDHTQGEQLTPTVYQRVGYSTPDSNWTTVNSTLVEDFGVAPDGTQSASKATKLAVGGSGSSNDRVKYSSIAITNGTTYSVSVHLKNIDVAGFTTIAARVSGGSLFRVKFIWNTSTLSSESGTTSNRLVEDLGDGWYRVSFSFESNGAAATLEIDIDRSTGGREDTSSILVWGAQLEEGTTATTFVANTTGSPLWIASPTFGPRVAMILVEPSATNLLPYSEDFSNSAWSKFGAGTGVVPTVTPDFGTSPDGTLSASRVQFNKGSGTSVGDMSNIFDSAQTSSGATTSKSVYLKSNTTEAYEMVIYEVTDASGTNVKKITVTPDWQRFHVYGAIASTTTGISIGLREISVSGLSNTADVLVWGAQVEAGSVSTSYIPTSGGDAAARTRAADDLVISGSAFTDFYNQSEGTIYVEYEPRIVSASNCLFIFSDGTTSHRILSLVSESYSLFINNGSNFNYFSVNVDPQANNLNRLACTFKTNNASASLNGSTGDYDTSLTMPVNSRLNLGTRQDGTQPLNGHIKRILYWPTHSDSL